MPVPITIKREGTKVKSFTLPAGKSVIVSVDNVPDNDLRVDAPEETAVVVEFAVKITSQ